MAGNFGTGSLARVGVTLQDVLTEGPMDPDPDPPANPSR